MPSEVEECFSLNSTYCWRNQGICYNNPAEVNKLGGCTMRAVQAHYGLIIWWAWCPCHGRPWLMLQPNSIYISWKWNKPPVLDIFHSLSHKLCACPGRPFLLFESRIHWFLVKMMKWMGLGSKLVDHNQLWVVYVSLVTQQIWYNGSKYKIGVQQGFS